MAGGDNATKDKEGLMGTMNEAPAPGMVNAYDYIEKSKLEYEEGTTPNQLSDYMVAYYTWLAKWEGLTPKRTKVGDLKLKNPDDFAGIYKKLTTMIDYVGGAYNPGYFD